MWCVQKSAQPATLHGIHHLFLFVVNHAIHMHIIIHKNIIIHNENAIKKTDLLYVLG